MTNRFFGGGQMFSVQLLLNDIVGFKDSDQTKDVKLVAVSNCWTVMSVLPTPAGWLSGLCETAEDQTLQGGATQLFLQFFFCRGWNFHHVRRCHVIIFLSGWLYKASFLILHCFISSSFLLCRGHVSMLCRVTVETKCRWIIKQSSVESTSVRFYVAEHLIWQKKGEKMHRNPLKSINLHM